MKIRIALNSNFASRKMRGAAYGILILLTFFVPQFANTQDRRPTPRPTPQRAGQVQSAPQLAPRASAPADTVLAPASIPLATGTANISDVKISSTVNATSIVITADRMVTPQKFRLNNPRRLVLDFPNSQNKVATNAFPVNDAAVKQLRVRQFQTAPSPIVRMVFDLTPDSANPEVVVSGKQVRVTFANNPLAATGASKISTITPATPALRVPLPERKNVAAVNTATPAPTPSTFVVEPEPTLEHPPVARTQAQPAPARASAQAPTLEKRQVRTPRSTPAATAAPTLERKPVAETPAQPAPTPVRTTAPAPVKKTVATTPASAPRPAATPVVAHQATPAPTIAKPVSAPQPALLAALTTPTTPVARSTPATSMSRFTGQPLTLDLVKVPLVDFFRLMAEEGGINVVLDPSVQGEVTIKVVKMPWDQIFDAVLANHGLDKQVEGTLVRIARKSTLQDEARQDEALKKATLLAAEVETRIKRLNYAKASELKNIIGDQKTVRGTIVVDERTNSLIITDLPNSVDKQIKLIESLDIPQPQVEIEARIVSATRNFARDIGIQFGFLQGNMQRVSVGGSNLQNGLSGSRPNATPSGTNEKTGDEAGSTDSISTGSNGAGNFNVNLPSRTPFGGIGISVGNIFDTFLLDAAITAGESKGWAKLISQPKVVTQNNKEAVVTNGVRFPVAVNADNTITIQFFDAALSLTATPQITYEGNILLELSVQNNTADFGYTSAGGVPTIRTSESKTSILVSDGGTTVIGGILVEDEGNNEDKVPGLGSLPVVGNIFRRNATNRQTQEILFFVTPRIVK